MLCCISCLLDSIFWCFRVLLIHKGFRISLPPLPSLSLSLIIISGWHWFIRAAEFNVCVSCPQVCRWSYSMRCSIARNMMVSVHCHHWLITQQCFSQETCVLWAEKPVSLLGNWAFGKILLLIYWTGFQSSKKINFRSTNIAVWNVLNKCDLL